MVIGKKVQSFGQKELLQTYLSSIKLSSLEQFVKNSLSNKYVT